ncbi:hypothetical protein BC834DRAFT_562706 [Gloeopeniophorella convolvens]|nr:hypothetical protein BC834DRAFT_562706 [Gloeopeniophorella convolvens]
MQALAHASTPIRCFILPQIYPAMRTSASPPFEASGWSATTTRAAPTLVVSGDDSVPLWPYSRTLRARRARAGARGRPQGSVRRSIVTVPAARELLQQRLRWHTPIERFSTCRRRGSSTRRCAHVGHLRTAPRGTAAARSPPTRALALAAAL